MKKILFIVFGIFAIGVLFSTKASAQQEATSDLWCEEAPAGTPVCNVDTNWANRRKQLGVDEVCCVYKEGGRGGKGSVSNPKSTPKASPKAGPKSTPKATSPKVTKPAKEVKPKVAVKTTAPVKGNAKVTVTKTDKK